jgi:hypothetical protein
MLSPEARLFCRLDNMPSSEREQQRLKTLSEMGLLELESVPIFEEATQTAAHLLDAAICILGFVDQDRQWFKSAIGLSRIGLMNDLAASRQLPRQESFCTHVVENHQVLIINDTANHPTFAESLLVRRYGIRAYLGVPLLTSSGFCLGTLAVMELTPRTFTSKEVGSLELIARWSMSEYERNLLLLSQKGERSPEKLDSTGTLTPTLPSQRKGSKIPSVKTSLIAQMTQELRTPLTSIMGMTSVLTREIYGPLTEKQKEYLNIVHNSGQYLLSLVNEILELGTLNDISHDLNLSPVDIEMLCQQAFATLEQAAKRREQTIQLSVEPGPRIWLLDKDKVRQMIYHLVFSVIQSSSTDSIIRIHISRKQNCLNLTIWTSHPWLGDGLPQAELHSHQLLMPSATAGADLNRIKGDRQNNLTVNEAIEHSYKSKDSALSNSLMNVDQPKSPTSRQSLGLVLSRQLAEMHNGSIAIQGSSESGYRYVISIPQTLDVPEHIQNQ